MESWMWSRKVGGMQRRSSGEEVGDEDLGLVSVSEDCPEEELSRLQFF